MTGPGRPGGLQYITCYWCSQRHTARYLCDPVVKLMEAMRLKGQEGAMPLIDISHAPIPLADMGLNAEDQIVRNFVVNSAVTDVAGVARPTLVITGRSLAGHTLPRWVYVGTDEEVASVSALVAGCAELAIATAQAQRGQPAP